MLWDIFCKVIDNHGDIGVCWRLASQLAGRGHEARLWVDDAAALAWMAPGGCPGVHVVPWMRGALPAEPGDAVIEAFGCELDASFQGAIAARAARGRAPLWINLEYLTAEPYAERSHGLPSPVMAGPAAGLTKHFFYPGFTARSGGLLRERDLWERQARFDRPAWLRRHGIAHGVRLASLFCYEPALLPQTLRRWAGAADALHLLVTSGRAAAAVRAGIEANDRLQPGWNAAARLEFTFLPLLAQPEFDHLLWACDINFVRGEDSLARALWAGRPFVWHIYPQHDDAHHAKLRAFLDWLDAPASLREFHGTWNGLPGAQDSAIDVAGWQACARDARQRLLDQDDLVTRLLRFAASQSPLP